MVQDVKEMLQNFCQEEGNKRRVEVNLTCSKKAGMYVNAVYDWESVPARLIVKGNIEQVIMKPQAFSDFERDDDAQRNQFYQQACEEWWLENSKSAEESWGSVST